MRAACLTLAALILTSCGDENAIRQSPAQAWVPKSAHDVISINRGSRDLIRLTTFTCSIKDISRLREEFRKESQAEWRPSPFDRRTRMIFDYARETFADNKALHFPAEPGAGISGFAGSAFFATSGNGPCHRSRTESRLVCRFRPVALLLSNMLAVLVHGLCVAILNRADGENRSR